MKKRTILMMVFAWAILSTVAPAAQDPQTADLQFIIGCSDFESPTDVSIVLDDQVIFRQDVQFMGTLPCEVTLSTTVVSGHHDMVVQSQKLQDSKRKTINVQAGKAPNWIYIFHGVAGQANGHVPQFYIGDPSQSPRCSNS